MGDQEHRPGDRQIRWWEADLKRWVVVKFYISQGLFSKEALPGLKGLKVRLLSKLNPC